MKAFFASALTLVIAFTAFAGLKAESYNNNYYHELINKVYYEIVLSVGNYSLITPKLVIKDSKKFVAKYSSKKNTIYFEMAAYELCRELGADSLNALAFILAHELAHHYREHGWLKRTGSSYAGLDIGKKLKAAGVSKDKILIYETEADIFAGFYAHVAGYNALPTAKLILDKIYEAYEIPHEIDHYPSLSERKNIAQRSEENLAQLIPVFDAAHNALLIGHYDEAISCLEYILSKKFNSREIYNNIGVAYAMQALEYFSTDELLYVYPFEFDVDSRLNSNARGKEDELTDGEKQERDRLLNLARKYFIISITLDWGYAMAYNNLASIEDLSGQMRDALFYNYKAESLSMDAPEMLAKVYLVHGVILANNGKNKDSRKFFNNYFAYYR
ncbi:MAG: hypothetical protein IIA45_15315 [Bacteroidetes bacterium]|nr:hypothetical protein [Bacteroidota bacterium]